MGAGPAGPQCTLPFAASDTSPQGWGDPLPLWRPWGSLWAHINPVWALCGPSPSRQLVCVRILVRVLVRVLVHCTLSPITRSVITAQHVTAAHRNGAALHITSQRITSQRITPAGVGGEGPRKYKIRPEQCRQTLPLAHIHSPDSWGLPLPPDSPPGPKGHKMTKDQ